MGKSRILSGRFDHLGEGVVRFRKRILHYVLAVEYRTGHASATPMELGTSASTRSMKRSRASAMAGKKARVSLSILIARYSVNVSYNSRSAQEFPFLEMRARPARHTSSVAVPDVVSRYFGVATNCSCPASAPFTDEPTIFWPSR